MTKFYTFMQNNSGGVFKNNKNVTEIVIIEANDTADANLRAERIGIYFDGVNAGYDCACCGDRWSEAYEWGGRDEGTEKPEIYGMSIEDYLNDRFNSRRSIFVHYKNGTKKEYGRQVD